MAPSIMAVSNDFDLRCVGCVRMEKLWQLMVLLAHINKLTKNDVRKHIQNER